MLDAIMQIINKVPEMKLSASTLWLQMLVRSYKMYKLCIFSRRKYFPPFLFAALRLSRFNTEQGGPHNKV